VNKFVATMAIFAIIALAYGLTTIQPAVGNVDESTTHAVLPADAPAVEERYFDTCLQVDYEIEDLPFYLRDFRQFKTHLDPGQGLLQEELNRWLKSYASILDKGSFALWGGNVTTEWKISDKKKITVIYAHYFVVNGEVYAAYPTGPFSLAEKSPKYASLSYAEYQEKRKDLSWEEWKKIDDLIRLQLLHACDWVWYGDDDTPGIKQLQEELRPVITAELGVESLDIEVPWEADPPLTLSDVIGFPDWQRNDIPPDVIYVGPNAAAAWMTVGANISVSGVKPERRMAYGELYAGYDWIRGLPQIARHELIHSYPQCAPLSWQFDVELWDEFYTNCVDIDAFDYLYHGYLGRVRRNARLYFGFDDAAARELIQKFRLGGVTEVDIQQFRAVQEHVKKISKEMKKLAWELYVEFYKDPFFAIALMDLFLDDGAFVDFIFAKHYAPVCLGDADLSAAERAIETQRWQTANASEIMRIWDKVKKDLENESNDRYEQESFGGSFLALSIWNGLPFSVQQQLSDAYLDGGIEAVLALIFEARTGGEWR